MALEAQEAEPQEGTFRRAEAILSKANLARMRGDLALAEQLCAEVLTDRPTDGTALAILAEIRYVQLRRDESLRLFELAHQSGEETPQVLSRIRELQPNLIRRQNRRPQILIIAAALGSVFIVVLAALLLAPRITGDRGSVMVHVSAPKDEPPVKAEPVKVEPNNQEVLADRTMATFIEQNAWASLRVLSATTNPRESMAFVSVTGKGSDVSRRLASAAAYAALSFDPDLRFVSVRVVSTERVTYIADMTREKATAIRTTDPSKALELADSSLSNEWNADVKASKLIQ